jgi:hypothetical protein
LLEIINEEEEEDSTLSLNIECEEDKELTSGNTFNLFNFSTSQICFVINKYFFLISYYKH